MNKKIILDKTREHIKKLLKTDTSAHDWWHIHRVVTTAKRIAEKEKGDMFIIELSALLHDIADWKFHGGNEKIGAETAGKWLHSLEVDQDVIDIVCEIVAEVSYKGAHVASRMKSLEGKIVQDADRLDAMGAIGIARAFAYGGFRSRSIYEPDIKPKLHNSPKAYIQGATHTINHFYEKLLLLKDKLNTKTAKKMAESRHEYMKDFLDRFYLEWNGEI